jgi:hypothetical protein
MKIQIISYLAEALPRSTPAMRQAITSVLTGQQTWRAAAIAHNVTESGILKAMQRSKVREFLAQQSTALTD